MGQVFNNIFNKAVIYDLFFFNVKSVLLFPNYKLLCLTDKQLSLDWKFLAETKFNQKINDDDITINEIYLKHAPNYSEFTKIVAITYATLQVEDGKLKRYLKSIVDIDEIVVINKFMDKLYQLSSAGVASTPTYFPILCGHDIISDDIPLLIKKIISYRNVIDNRGIPYILKNALNIKPWESGVIDTSNIWNFNGYRKMSLRSIANFLKLKSNVDLLDLKELSQEYWKLSETNENAALKLISLQSATQTNYVIQLVNELRAL